jgi:hypothetical protein
MLSALFAIALAAIEAPAPSPDADPIVCKASKTPEVGTRMKPKRVCMRRSQWDYEAGVTQIGLRKLTDKGRHPGEARGR